MEIVRAIKCEKCGHLMEMPIKKEEPKPKKERKRKLVRWKDSEVQYLKDYYAVSGAETIAKALSKTTSSVANKASQLGLKRKATAERTLS